MRRALVALLVVLAIGLSAAYLKREEWGPRLAEAVPATAPYLGRYATHAETSVAASSAVKPPPPALPVVVARAAKGPMPVVVEGVGTVQSIASIGIKPRIDSQVVGVHVEEGARVKQGDLLFPLDARALKAQLAQADAQVLRDRAQLEQARRDLQRSEELLGKRITSEVQRDTAATAVKVQEAVLASDQAQRENLATSVSYTEIRAPVSGRIGSISAKIGTNVRTADSGSIATVNQVDPIYVSFAVPQANFGNLRAALSSGKVSVEVRAGGKTISGSIAFVENTVEAATGTVLAKAIFPNPDEQLWPGAFVSARGILGIEQDAVSVPSSAMQIGQQGAFVFVINGDRAELRPVTVSRTVGADAVIAKGLSGDENVVVDGQLRLIDGARVRVQSPRGGEAVVPREVAPRG